MPGFPSQGNSLKVTIIGTGYVGLVTGACLADVGHEVLCVDLDRSKVERLDRGEIPIHEPGLQSVVHRNQAERRLSFTASPAEGAAFGEVLMIAVGTPPDEDGSADLSHVLAAAKSIGEHLERYVVIVNKSTVPVGTGDLVEDAIRQALEKRGSKVEFSVVSNPEFLKEGAAVEDFQKPDRIILGTGEQRAERIMRELYAPFQRNRDRVLVMSRRSAELTKYAANAMLATRISFMNELANLAEAVGGDIEEVRRGIGSDTRIGYSFLYAGTGYGGSCFPKDVKAIMHSARTAGLPLRLLDAVDAVNEGQKLVLVRKALNHFGGSLRGKRFALWGLAFKPDTDDMREAPARAILEALWAEGATVQAYDPLAMNECRRIYGNRRDLVLTVSPMEAVVGVDALFIATEAKPYRAPNFNDMLATMNAPVIFDGRNLYEPASLRKLGFDYYGVGR
jgi:UDPglucose 6-dehydrogenase